MGHTASDGKDKNQTPAFDGASVMLRGSVEKIMPSSDNNRSEVVQIVIEGAESLYREIRILNLLRDADGGSVALQPGSEVEITIKVRAGT
jgi:hypothetical protein